MRLSSVFRRCRRVGAASGTDRMIWLMLWPRRNDSQVTPLGVYRTNHGRKLRAK